jgi:hypothetical protein
VSGNRSSSVWADKLFDSINRREWAYLIRTTRRHGRVARGDLCRRCTEADTRRREGSWGWADWDGLSAAKDTLISGSRAIFVARCGHNRRDMDRHRRAGLIASEPGVVPVAAHLRPPVLPIDSRQLVGLLVPEQLGLNCESIFKSYAQPF